MHNITSVELTRDCHATQIPSGALLVLPAGTAVDITQSLGGNYTVHALNGGLFQIANGDADALGLGQTADVMERSPVSNDPVDSKAVWEALRTCYDPEIPVNIVDLGLIYDLQIQALANSGTAVSVKMTLTAPGCGMGGMIAGEAERKLREIPGVEHATVEIVWDPPWHPSLISEEGRKILGLD